jgi:hypothetical protein
LSRLCKPAGDYESKFNLESLIGQLAGIFSGLAIFISCLGLFGLAPGYSPSPDPDTASPRAARHTRPGNAAPTRECAPVTPEWRTFAP